ncbi:hypothetical protein B0H10DRAFT_2031552 [Mycena sp. CBHHK59/15]|nr:hypothetical protein B0H10DRAFT_2031552 [Mycena sp. CBHHK59/15]
MQGALPPKAYVPNATRIVVATLLCSSCFRRSENIQLCSKCKRVGYCNKPCQTQDWQDHKTICKQFQKVNTYDMKSGHTDSPDPASRLTRYLLEQENRGNIFSEPTKAHPYGRFPIQHIIHGKKCQVCFRTPFHDTNHSFSACTKCKLAWWCSPTCKERFPAVHTATHCASLYTEAADESVRIAYGLATRSQQALLFYPKTLQKSYIPPSSLNGWGDYQAQVFPDFKSTASRLADEFNLRAAHPDAMRAVELLGSEAASMPLTLLGAMEDTISDLQARTKLCIHVVGAATREMRSLDMMEELLHYLPRLKAVTLVYIGPNLRSLTVPGQSSNLACVSCKKNGRCRTTICRATTYHEFATSQEYRANTPDLVAGFNTGMSEVEVEGWKTSVRCMLDSAVPAVFTAYTALESIGDKQMLQLDLAMMNGARVTGL